MSDPADLDGNGEVTAIERWAARTGNDLENNNSNSDLDLIEGDGIGGDNSLDSNEQAAEDFAESIATGEYEGHAPDSEVNAALGTDGDAVAVAATAEEIEQAGGSVLSYGADYSAPGTTGATGGPSSVLSASLSPSTAALGGDLTIPLGVFAGILLLGIAYAKMEGSA